MFSRRFVGWIACISVFTFFSKLFCFFMFFLFSFRGGSWAGYPVFLFLCFSRSFSVSLCFVCFRFAEVRGLDILYFCFSVFLEAFLFFFVFASRRFVGWISCIYVFLCFSRSFYVSFCFFCFRFAEVRGLDILYFCCFYVFSRSFSVSLCFFMFSPSLFKLLHVQSNKYI